MACGPLSFFQKSVIPDLLKYPASAGQIVINKPWPSIMAPRTGFSGSYKNSAVQVASTAIKQ